MSKPQSLYNVNVGVLGHVDSGKTSLVAALSTTLSTAALDKHPQSKERGITLDLGFSSFNLPAPPLIASKGFDAVQFTLVDCPGHASLIRTVVGGAQIMDMMVLVIDVTKGIQTQTAECIVIGEITTDKMIVVLNKIDQLEPEKREKHIKKAKKMVAATLAATKFAKCTMVAVSALCSSEETTAAAASGLSIESCGLEDLKQTLLDSITLRQPIESTKSTTPQTNQTINSSAKTTTNATKQSSPPPFLFFIDHCFAIKGQGTVLTGTVARGSLSVGDTLELPALKQQKKVKSMQIFRRPVNSCQQGDRVGICVTQLEAGSVERGLAAAPGSIPTFSGAVVQVEKVRFYPGIVKSGSKMHVIVGHQTIMAKFTFFGMPRGTGEAPTTAAKEGLEKLSISDKNSETASIRDGISDVFDYNKEYLYRDELYGIEGRPAKAELAGRGGGGSGGELPSTSNEDYYSSEDLLPAPPHHGPQYAIVQFDEPVTAPPDSLIIGARLDSDLHTAACRIALSGHIQSILDSSKTSTSTGTSTQKRSSSLNNTSTRVPSSLSSSSVAPLHRLKVYKLKQRFGTVERVESDGYTAICRGMFSKESDLTRFIGMTVTGGPRGSTKGVLESSFGKSGKFKVKFMEPIIVENKKINGGDVVGGSNLGSSSKNVVNQQVVLEYKRFIFDLEKRRIAQ